MARLEMLLSVLLVCALLTQTLALLRREVIEDGGLIDESDFLKRFSKDLRRDIREDARATKHPPAENADVISRKRADPKNEKEQEALMNAEGSMD